MEEKGAAEDEMLDGITNSMVMSLSNVREIVKTGKPGVLRNHGVSKSQTRRSD